MKLRAFAAAWTVFTALAAPALLVAQEPPQPAGQPPAQTVPGAPVPEAAPSPAPVAPPEAEPGAAAEEPPATPAPEEAATEESRAEPAEAQREPAAREPRPDAAPRARKAASAAVTIKDFSFSPTALTVNVGDTVTWTNAGPTVHTATGDGFDTGNLTKGQSGSHTFTAAGAFSYICTPHPFMKASVTVSEAEEVSGPPLIGEEAPDDADAAPGPSLPDTGADAWALALLGTGLLAFGFAARRRTGRVSG